MVNRLFFEQDPRDPKAVVPVYYLFRDNQEDRLAFAIEYLENFMRYYLAFHIQRPEIITQTMDGEDLRNEMNAALKTHPHINGLERLLRWHHSMCNGRMNIPEKEAVEIPRRMSDIDDSTIVMFLDEFQNTHLPQTGFQIVGYMQDAVESYTCPHFVTGSALSILAREILGRGSLFGRFDSEPIEPLSEYWGIELVKKAAIHYGASVSELMAPIVATRCGGNPFYIVSVIRQSAKSDKPLVDEDSINDVLAFDITSGFIWAELGAQVDGWIERVNKHNITKWVLYLAALEEEEKISLERIQHEMEEKEGLIVSLDTIKEALVRLSRGDLVEDLELGGWFRKVDDPILLEFLKIWGRIEVEGKNQDIVRNELILQYERQKRRISEYKGYLAEVFMGQVLLNSHEHKVFPAHFFNAPEDIKLKRPVIFVHHRVRLRSGEGEEMDILASLGGQMWVCQSKWETTKKVGVATIQQLLDQAKGVQKQDNPLVLHKWIFAHQGLTQEAQALATENGVFWSTRSQFDELLHFMGLRKLPNIEAELDGNEKELM